MTVKGIAIQIQLHPGAYRLRHLFGRTGLSRFLQWRLNAALVRWLPLPAGRAYLQLLGKLYYWLYREEKEQIERNISSVLRSLRAGEPLELSVRQTFQGIFCHYFEKLFTAYCGYEKVCRFLRRQVRVEGLEPLRRAVSQGRGVILVTGHFGGVEFLPSALALRGYPVSMVVRFKTERLKQVLVERAARVGMTLLDADEEERLIFSALQALKAGKILITECDEFKAWRPHRRRCCSFLGCTGPVDRTLDLLQRRSKSPVLMGLVYRQPGNRYALRLRPLQEQAPACAGPTVTERALQILERAIYQAPEQWYQWKELHTVFKRKPLTATGRSRAPETDRSLPVADTPAHAHQA